MDQELQLLVATALSIGTVHTLLGPDHYLPFVAMAAAGQWSNRKMLWVTALCGLGHVLGSVLLGAAGLAVGAAVADLEGFEALRGDAAAWALTGVGLAYGLWGLRQAQLSRPGVHLKLHGHGVGHSHRHSHGLLGSYVHSHSAEALEVPVPASPQRSLTPWALFVVFVLGPCEPLIPILMYPAAKLSLAGTLAVVLAFGAATLATMLTAVYLARSGLRRLSLGWAERYAHALAGASLGLCGLGMVFLGL